MGGSDLAMDWSSLSQVQLPEVNALRRAIHADPEVGLQCPRTTDKVKAAYWPLAVDWTL